MYLTHNTTSSTRSLLGDQSPADAKSKVNQTARSGTNSDQHSADLFRRMLNAEPDLPAPPAPWSPQLLYTPAESQSDAGTASRAPSGTNAQPNMPLTAVKPTPLDSQMLDLRASTGPLAGLRLQANWQGARLNLRLSAPSTELADRLQREGKNLSAALSASLGVEVIVQVQQAMEDANEDHQ